MWTRSRQFRVNASSSLRQWSVSLTSILKPGGHVDEHAEYVPTYDEPQLFRWRGYWAEIRRGGSNKKQREFDNIGMDNSQGKLSLTYVSKNNIIMLRVTYDLVIGYTLVIWVYCLHWSTMLGRDTWQPADHMSLCIVLMYVCLPILLS